MNNAVALVLIAGLAGGLVYVAARQQRRNRINWACQIYDAVKASGRLNSAEVIGAERWLNLALTDRGLAPRYPFARLEAVSRKPDITVNIDKMLVVETTGLQSEMPRQVPIKVINVTSNAPALASGQRGVVRRNA